ncbi:MAG: tetratricopeptide repeat protein [Verrucomicrobiota bacterium]
MKLLFLQTCAIALLVGGLLTGCRTTPAPSSSQTGEPSEEVDITLRAKAYAHYSAGIVQELNNNAPAAWEEFYLAAKTDSSDPELLNDIANRLIEGRQFEQALEVLKRAAKLPSPNGTVYMRLGFVYSQLGRSEKAIEANQLAVQRLPGFLPAWHNLYLSHVQARQAEQALATLDQAAKQLGVDAEYRLSLAELYANCGQQFPPLRPLAQAKAVTLLDQLLAEDSVRGMARLKLADGFYLFNQTEKAARLYLDFLTHGEPPSPLREILRAKLTEIYLRGKDNARATEQLLAITRDDPANAGAKYFLGALALQNRRWDEAMDWFRQALVINPDFEVAQLDLAAAQIAIGKNDEAITALKGWRNRKPASFALEYLLGLAFHGQEKYADAVTHFSAAELLARAAETNRLDTGFYFQVGVAHERLGKRETAAQYFEKSIALAPDNADALNYLGYMWAEQGENLLRARELIERALKLEPENDAFLDSMGWVLFKLGDARAALPYLEKSAAQLPQPDATVYDHLGDVYAALNQGDKAREAWAKSLTVEANAAVRQKLEATPKSTAP